MYSKLATKMSVAVELIDTREQERDEARQIAREACGFLEVHAAEDPCCRCSAFLARPDVQRLLAMEGR
jgi:hypothetical protein